MRTTVTVVGQYGQKPLRCLYGVAVSQKSRNASHTAIAIVITNTGMSPRASLIESTSLQWRQKMVAAQITHSATRHCRLTSQDQSLLLPQSVRIRSR